MTTYNEFVERRKNEFERRIKEHNQNHPLIVKLERHRIEENIKPVNIPGIFSQKPKNEMFLAKLRKFEAPDCIKKIPKSRLHPFQESSLKNIQNGGKSIISKSLKSKS